MTLEQYRALCPRFNYLGQVLMDNSASSTSTCSKPSFRNRASGINNAETYGCTTRRRMESMARAWPVLFASWPMHSSRRT